jgi:hypothetical protein
MFLNGFYTCYCEKHIYIFKTTVSITLGHWRQTYIFILAIQIFSHLKDLAASLSQSSNDTIPLMSQHSRNKITELYK